MPSPNPIDGALDSLRCSLEDLILAAGRESSGVDRVDILRRAQDAVRISEEEIERAIIAAEREFNPRCGVRLARGTHRDLSDIAKAARRWRGQ